MKNKAKKTILGGVMGLVSIVSTNVLTEIRDINTEVDRVEKIIAIEDKIDVNEKEKNIFFTDDNNNENFIIKTDNKDYTSIGGGVMAYFSITNVSRDDQNADIIFSFGEGQKLRLDYIEYLSGYETVIEEVPKLKNETCNSTTTKTVCETITEKNEYKVAIWDKLYTEKKERDTTRKDLKTIKDRKVDKGFLDYFKSGETKYYRADIYIPLGIKQGDEWFIEAFGEKDYGNLDPNNWTYEQTFNSLTTADLTGQDSWTGSTNFDVQTSNTYEGAKSVLMNGGVKGDIQRSITSITSGIFYFSARIAGTAGSYKTTRFNIKSGSTRAIIIDFVNVSSGVTDIRLYSTGAKYVDTTPDVYTRIGIDFDTSTDTFKANIDDGTWSSSKNFYTAVSSINLFQIRMLNATAGDGYFDFISPNYAATPPATSRRIMLIN